MVVEMSLPNCVGPTLPPSLLMALQYLYTPRNMGCPLLSLTPLRPFFLLAQHPQETSHPILITSVCNTGLLASPGGEADSNLTSALSSHLFLRKF